jgi:hypothetical protein
MSNVIDFLERLGRDAQLRHADDRELEQVMINAQIDPAVRAAILVRDQSQLEALLGAHANVCCMIATPAQEQHDEEEEEQKQDDDDRQDDGDDEKALQRTAV